MRLIHTPHFILMFLVLIGLTFADVTIEIEWGEKDIGDFCTSHYECPTWLCIDNKCSNCTKDADCNETTFLCVDGRCKLCESHLECESLRCVDGICSNCTNDGECFTNFCNKTSGKCTYCSTHEQCNTLRCVEGICESCQSDFDCFTNLCNKEKKVCEKCKDDEECATELCDKESGICYCLWLGEECPVGVECCSGICRSNVCVASFTPVDNINRRLAKAIEIKIEQNRSSIHELFLNLMQWKKKKIRYVNTCVYGAPCDSDDDCCGAECVDGACYCSIEWCMSSGECCSGYCENNKCVKAPSTSFFILNSILSKPGPIGCSGLIEECLPGEMGCVYFCNALFGILAALSIILFFVSWKRYNNVLLGFALGAITFLFGLVTYEFVGIIINAITLVLVYHLKPSRK